MSKRVLITGASGLLGRAIFKEFEGREAWETLGLAFSRVGLRYKKVDLTDPEAVAKVVQDFKPTVIIHSAAEKRPDVVEKEEEKTKQLNIDATRTLCQCAASVGAWVVFISTDYVFDGKDPPYTESAAPNPLNKYGLSKLEGERVVLSVSQDNSVVRIPILYGDVEYIGESAVTLLFDKVQETSQGCVMSDYERRHPTHCADVAFVLAELCEAKQQNKNIQGIYHCSSDENMTKYDMAVTMAEVFDLSKEHIKSDRNPSPGAVRPYNTKLACPRLTELGIKTVRRIPFREGIKNALLPHFEAC